ncbi:MAG: endolytic transglycosylase MltG [Elusimicrobiota bacterium]
MKKILFLILFLILIILVYFCIPYKETVIKIPEGSTPKQVAKILKNGKIIKSENLFLTLVWLTKTEKKFKYGTYKLNNKIPNWIILKKIVNGDTYRIKITIPEGLTTQEIAELLEKKGICSSRRFLDRVKNKKLEGYLFPETYFFEPATAENKIVQMLYNQFKKIFVDEFIRRTKELKLTEKQIIILASIIEKEAKKDEERPLVSAVFHNRLKKGWNLESCATILYAMGEHKSFLTYQDLKINSLYNTYIHPGLPPGAICNPGLKSIKAALYPSDSEDMFFVADGSGTHIFSKYIEEHNSKKKQRKTTNKNLDKI